MEKKQRAVEFFENSWKIPGIPLGKTDGFACWTKVLCAIWWYVSDKPNPSMNSKEFVTENIQKIKDRHWKDFLEIKNV